MEEAVQARRALELDLREAIGTDQFELYFQPLVDLRNGRITTCEALVRWIHPIRGNVPPAVFIPIAEETGLIIRLGEWVLERACREASNCRRCNSATADWRLPSSRHWPSRGSRLSGLRSRSPSASSWRRATRHSPSWSS